MITMRELLDQLAAEGALAPDLPERAAVALAADSGDATPWYIHLLVAVGAWVAALLLIAFFVIANIVDSGESAVTVGLLLCAGALALRHGLRRLSWLAQVPLAVSLAGEAMVFVGVLASGSWLSGDSLDTALLAIIALELALLALYRDWLHRFLSTWIIVAALCGLLISNELQLGAALLTAGLGWAVALAWLRESALAAGAFGRPIAYGLVAGLFSALLILLAGEAGLHWPASLGLAAALAFVAWSLLQHAAPQALVAGLAGALLLLAPAWETPGILAAALVLIVGYSRRSRALVALGGLFLAGFLSFYYYSLDITLLLKSFYLAGAGLLLLAARAFLQRAAPRPGLR